MKRKAGKVRLLPQNRGFTLVEIVVVAVVVSLLGIEIAATFIAGLRLWDRARRADFERTAILITLEKIAKELRQTFVLPVIPCQGTREEFVFPAIEQGVVVQLTYSFNRGTKSLMRRQVGLAQICHGQDAGETIERCVANADNITCGYLRYDPAEKKLGWVDSWTTPQEAFKAIKIHVEYGGETIEKTISIPIS